MGRNGTYFTWVASSYRVEARGLWMNDSPRERSLIKFHLSESRISLILENQYNDRMRN